MKAKNKLMGSLGNGAAIPGKVPYEREPQKNTKSIEFNKKNKLSNILGREELKSKKERVGHVLVQNFSKKYGFQYKPIIQFYVEEVCDRTSSLLTDIEVSSEDVDDLERSITKAISATENGELNQFKVKQDSRGSQETQEKERASSSIKREDSSKSMKAPPGSEWLAIMAYQSIVGEEKTKSEQAKVRNGKESFKKMLDEQMVGVNKSKASSATEDLEHYHRTIKDVSKYEEDEKRKNGKKELEAKKQYRFQQEQIADNLRRRGEEKALAEAIDQNQIYLAKLAIQKEETKIRTLKEKEAERRRVVEIENERNKKIQAELKAQLAAEDQRLAAESVAKLNREDAARAAAFEARMAKMAGMGAKFETEGAGKVMREAKIREEKLLLLEQARKEERDREKELKKVEDAKQRNVLDLQENGRQVAEKKAKIEQEALAELQFREKFKKEADQYKQSLQQDKAQSKQKKAQYKNVLESQINHLKTFDRNLTGCSKVEAEINKPIFSAIEEDPHIKSRVMHRIRMDATKK